MIQAQVEEADAGIRLDRWFKRHHPHVAHGMLEKALRKGQVKLNGAKAKASDRVEQWHVITLPEEWTTPEARAARPPRARAEASDADARMLQDAVLYRDEHVIVLNKPAGLAVQGGTKQTRSLDDLLDCLRFDATERPKLTHRLDRDTSGCLVLARSSRAATAVTRAFASREAEKVYVALVVGMPQPLFGTIDLPLAKALRDVEKMDVDEEAGKPAVTEYRVVEHLGDRLSWVEMRPLTGRTHQLRVHMASIGHPIIGDGKYGGAEAYIRGSLAVPRQLHLHAAHIRIEGLFGKTLDVKAPLPPHIKKTRELLGMD